MEILLTHALKKGQRNLEYHHSHYRQRAQHGRWIGPIFVFLGASQARKVRVLDRPTGSKVDMNNTK